MGLFGSSLSYYNRAIELYNTMPDSFKTSPDVKQPPWIILNIGSIYFKNGDLEKAEEKYNQALKIFKSLKNKEDSQNGINTTESNLGLIDEQRGKFIEAEKKYLKIYERRLQNDKHEDIVYSLSQLIAINFQFAMLTIIAIIAIIIAMKVTRKSS